MSTRCPHCGSEEIVTFKKRKIQHCEDCQQEWRLTEFTSDSTVSLSEAADESVRAFCRELAKTAEWVATVENDWPAPLAHEYHQLKQLLEDGQIIGAIWQLKDIAEVLIKFPAIVMAQTVLSGWASSLPPFEKGGQGGFDKTLQDNIRQKLLGKPLAMGDWHRLAGDELAPLLLQDAQVGAVAQLFRTDKGKVTLLYELLRDLNEWRNEQIGHGALRLQVKEFQGDLERYVEELNHCLQAVADVWAGMRLKTATGEELHGWQHIRERHETQVQGEHREEEVALELEWNQQKLSLAPLAMLKRCTVCQRQDVFFFDSRKSREDHHEIYFLDYLAGHKMNRPGHLEPQLAVTVKSGTASPEEGSFKQDYLRTDLDRLLEEKSLEASYLSPQYLRQPLKDFIETHDSGVFWLQAPAHVGKSIFVYGLSLKEKLEKRSLVPELQVITFHIRREYRYHLALIKDYLTDELKTVLQLRGLEKELPLLDLQATDGATAFSEWFAAWLQIYRQVHQRPAARLLVCLDGLDELVSSESRSLLDFLPQRLESGCYLLVTSRPQADCPAMIWQRLQTLWAEVTTLRIALDDRGYRTLLRQYFDQHLRNRFKQTLYQTLRTFYDSQQTLPEWSQLSSGLVDKAQREQVKSEWDECVRLTGCQPHRLAKELVSQLLATIQPVYQQFDTLFQQVLERGEQRFLYISHLCNLLRDYRLPLTALHDLPSGEGLYTHYLQQLESVLASKQWDFLKRVLLILAATEAAAIEDVAIRTTARELDWRGISLPILAYLLGETTSHSARLLFALYSLKEVLWVDKTAVATARYKLGLKGLRDNLQQQWQTDLAAFHQHFVHSFQQTWQDQYERIEPNDVGNLYGLRYLLAHVNLSADAALHAQLWANEALAGAYNTQGIQASEERAHYQTAVEWFTCMLRLYEKQSQHTGRADLQNSLAAAYMNRGNALQSQGDLAGAVGDYGVAIAHLEQLKQTLVRQGQAWSPQWQNDLAKAYVNRGNALQSQGDLAGAVGDTGVAIAHLEQLQQTLDRQGQAWPPEFQNVLAGAYMNRGVALDSQGDLASAVGDYGVAIALREQLKQTLDRQGQAWPPQWQNDLAAAYMNRGVALKNQGDLAGAVGDYGVAIELREQLKQTLASQGQAWSPQWQNALAAAYMNRGVAFANQGDLAGAVGDTGVAIALREQLKQTLDRQGQAWPPQWQNSLAAAYMNRGNALQSQGDLAGAVGDYGVAIAHLEQLQQTLASQGQAWSPQWQNYLAGAYMNRGNALQSQGDLAGAVGDYGVAIELMERILFEQEFVPVLPDLAIAYYNLVLLSQRDDLPATLSAAELQQSARAFLQRLAAVVDMERLPVQWRREVEDLREVMNG